MFAHLKQFLEMGGFAFYIWISYGVAFLVLSFILFSTLKQKKNIVKQCSEMLKGRE